MTALEHRNRTPKEIISESVYFDGPGFMYRAMPWLDLADRSGHFAAFQYACIDARLAIEHLIFEQLAITAGDALDAEKYEHCVANPRKLDKLLQQIVPDYEKLQEFTQLVVSLSPGHLLLNHWDIKDLRKSWGRLSRYLHWTGAHPQTTEDPSWKAREIREAKAIIEPLWQKISSGHTGTLRPEDMKPPVRGIWAKFKTGEIDFESARVRLGACRRTPIRPD